MITAAVNGRFVEIKNRPNEGGNLIRRDHISGIVWSSDVVSIYVLSNNEAFTYPFESSILAKEFYTKLELILNYEDQP